MTTLLLVGFGGFLGTCLRYFTQQILSYNTFISYGFGTIVVNLIGSFLIGLFFGISNKISSNTMYIFLTTGILGGFTTYSAFSLDFFMYLKEGKLQAALVYAISTLLLGLCLTYSGFLVSKIIS